MQYKCHCVGSMLLGVLIASRASTLLSSTAAGSIRKAIAATRGVSAATLQSNCPTTRNGRLFGFSSLYPLFPVAYSNNNCRVGSFHRGYAIKSSAPIPFVLAFTGKILFGNNNSRVLKYRYRKAIKLQMSNSSDSQSTSKKIGRVALLQFRVSADKESNIQTASDFLSQAKENNAHLAGQY